MKAVQVGDRVVVHHHLGCGVCYQCSRGETIACSIDHKVLGSDVPGGFGQFLVAPERNCIPLPAQVSFEDGAALACVGTTAYGALRRLGARAHESLAVLGLGPVGLSTVLVGRALGLRVIGVDVVKPRVDLALLCGAQVAVDASDGDPIEAVRAFGRRVSMDGSDGVDWVIEASGSASGRSNVLPALRQYGGAAIVGGGSNEKVIDPTDIHRTRATVRGSVVFPLAWLWEALQLCAVSGLTFQPAITHRFDLEDAVEAFRLADGGRVGKVLFVGKD